VPSWMPGEAELEIAVSGYGEYPSAPSQESEESF
jgi:hypothetical protein